MNSMGQPFTSQCTGIPNHGTAPAVCRDRLHMYVCTQPHDIVCMLIGIKEGYCLTTTSTHKQSTYLQENTTHLSNITTTQLTAYNYQKWPQQQQLLSIL